MNVKSFFVLISVLIFVKAQEIDSQDEDLCYNIYECCEKLETQCVRYCEPVVYCNNNATNRILGLESFQKPSNFTIIAVDCRKGYRLVEKLLKSLPKLTLSTS